MSCCPLPPSSALPASEQELREMSGLFAQVTAALGFPLTLPIPGTPHTRGVAARQQIIARLQPQIDKYRAALAEGGTGGGLHESQGCFT
jgi:hypothetical protein